MDIRVTKGDAAFQATWVCGMEIFTCHCNNLDTVFSEETLQKVEPQGYMLMGTTALEDD